MGRGPPDMHDNGISLEGCEFSPVLIPLPSLQSTTSLSLLPLLRISCAAKSVVSFTAYREFDLVSVSSDNFDNNVEIVELDLSSRESFRNFMARYRKQCGRRLD